MKNVFLKIGHRGNGAGYGENTALSINLALLAGADGIEYDVRKTKDGQIVLMHDENIWRTTNGGGKVSHHTYEKLKQLNAGYGECIPLLDDVFRRFGNCFHNIELKENIGEKVIHLVTKHGMTERVLVSSFNWSDLIPFSETEIPTALLAGEEEVQKWGESGILNYASYYKASAMNISFKAVTPSLVELAHKYALKIYPWTVDEPNDIALMKKYGVDGVISNYPERL